MIDPLRTLDPSLGLVSTATVYPPNEVGLWRTVGYLANGRDGSGGFATAVGAFDVSKRGSMTRGAGEAVERFALAPVAADAEYLHVGMDGAEARIDFVTAGLGRAAASAVEFPWYRATNLATGKESQVPAPVVDYCPGERAAWSAYFDPSPNGAAAGPSGGFAQASGIAEALERDAFLSAWRQRVPLDTFEPHSVGAAPGSRGLLVLLEAAKEAGIEPTLAFVPNTGGPLETAVCIITGHGTHGPFGAVGIKASADPIAALRGALQEGLQIRELFLSRTPSPAETVKDDETRADFWSTERAVAELRQWVGTFRPCQLLTAHPAPDLDALVNYLAGRGIHPHWVSLTHRLPHAVQELGWVTGKVICPGLVPLTMDERKGLALSLAPGALTTFSTPHPLI